MKLYVQKIGNLTPTYWQPTTSIMHLYTAALMQTTVTDDEVRKLNLQILYILTPPLVSIYPNIFQCTVGSWKLSRTGILTPQDNAAINEVITKTQGLTNKYYQITDQSDEACFYYPDITPNDSIIIPGQCDETISGFAPFDINQVRFHIILLTYF